MDISSASTPTPSAFSVIESDRRIAMASRNPTRSHAPARAAQGCVAGDSRAGRALGRASTVRAEAACAAAADRHCAPPSLAMGVRVGVKRLHAGHVARVGVRTAGASRFAATPSYAVSASAKKRCTSASARVSGIGGRLCRNRRP
ncbi:DNA-directed RNA polymerase [Mizugakiibacter sediminis]|uniref:DNA-directed RNA polymerase n=1 Tax=Mizugakiibacter sediminis TaxID=1475481 RepID=A0A0K8QNJ8_9GAMM|nr:DNA-directed RNA polymerase [Mizugakiibacter sediminis]